MLFGAEVKIPSDKVSNQWAGDSNSATEPINFLEFKSHVTLALVKTTRVTSEMLLYSPPKSKVFFTRRIELDKRVYKLF